MKTKIKSKPKKKKRERDDKYAHDHPSQSESHGGVLKSTEYRASDFFEFGGQKLLLRGTSGPAKEPSRIAEGQPIRHDISAAGRIIPAEAASGFNQFEGRVADAGQPVQQRPSAQDAASGLTGTGQLTGGPIRRT